MSAQRHQAAPQGSEGRLGHDRLQQGSDELAQQAPRVWAGQAAKARPSAQRGEFLEFVDERLEQKDDQEMGQQIGSGGEVFVGSGGPFRPIRLFKRLNPSSIRHRRR